MWGRCLGGRLDGRAFGAHLAPFGCPRALDAAAQVALFELRSELCGICLSAGEHFVQGFGGTHRAPVVERFGEPFEAGDSSSVPSIWWIASSIAQTNGALAVRRRPCACSPASQRSNGAPWSSSRLCDAIHRQPASSAWAATSASSSIRVPRPSRAIPATKRRCAMRIDSAVAGATVHRPSFRCGSVFAQSANERWIAIARATMSSSRPAGAWLSGRDGVSQRVIRRARRRRSGQAGGRARSSVRRRSAGR